MVAARPVGVSGIRDVKDRFIDGEDETIRLVENGNDALDASCWVNPIDATRLLRHCIRTTFTAEDSVRRIGEPDRTILCHSNVIWRVERFSLEAVSEDGDRSIVFGTVTRRVWCSQVTSRPALSIVLPFAWAEGLRKVVTIPSRQRKIVFATMSVKTYPPARRKVCGSFTPTQTFRDGSDDCIPILAHSSSILQMFQGVRCSCRLSSSVRRRS